MAVIRILALFFIVVAIMLMGADIVTTLETPGGMVVRSLDRVLQLVRADAKGTVERSFPVWMAGPSLAVLASPASAVFGTLGILFALLGLPGRSASAPPPQAPPIRR
jgi:hypothetical protein